MHVKRCISLGKHWKGIQKYWHIFKFFKWPYQPKWHLALECVFLVIDTKQVGTWYVENARENVGLQFQYMYTLCMWKDFANVFNLKIFVLADSERLNAEAPRALSFKVVIESLQMKTCRGPKNTFSSKMRACLRFSWHRLQHNTMYWETSQGHEVYNNIWYLEDYCSSPMHLTTLACTVLLFPVHTKHLCVAGVSKEW